MFMLVRAAHAGHQRRWSGADEDRPLSERGRQQSLGLAHNLSALYAPRLISSPYRRCRQTLEPLADHTRSSIEVMPALAINDTADTGNLAADLLDPALDGAVLCTHGSVVTAVIRRWQRDGSVTFTDALTTSSGPGPVTGGTEKGAAWIIVDTASRPTAHYLRPLHVGPVLDTGSPAKGTPSNSVFDHLALVFARGPRTSGS